MHNQEHMTRLVLLTFLAGILIGLLMRRGRLASIGSWNGNKAVFGNWIFGIGNTLNVN